jgi:hypothetical protein
MSDNRSPPYCFDSLAPSGLAGALVVVAFGVDFASKWPDGYVPVYRAMYCIPASESEMKDVDRLNMATLGCQGT